MGLYQIYHPPVFQGVNKKESYFEGWYFKQVSRDYSQVLALIPGLSLSDQSHAFIQVIDGKSGQTHYLEFPASDFSAKSKGMEIQIGPNLFTPDGFRIDLQDENLQLKGELQFKNTLTWPVRPWSPGIMGWYRFVPYMECYHGVVSINHEVTGILQGSASSYNFNGGYGYIEKDWGTSFPEQWIWLHANCFPDKSTALMLSVAKIPWRGKFFVGFICFIHTGGKLYRFLTYNGSKITQANQQGLRVRISLENRNYQLDIEADQLLAGDLKAPVFGKMERYIKESIDSLARFKLSDKKGNTLAEGTSFQAGLEIVGAVISLL